MTIKHELSIFLGIVHNNTLVGEAVQLANDFGSICEKEFPAKALAEHACKNYFDPQIIDMRKNEIVATKFVA